VDFCCLEKKLAIELDGGHHKSRREYDERRTQFLEREGFLVLRFWDNEMLKEPEAVLNMILDVLESPYDQKPALSPP
jgi:very-short-patch-repair endonuclease